jgi:hypothetical protein
VSSTAAPAAFASLAATLAFFYLLLLLHLHQLLLQHGQHLRLLLLQRLCLRLLLQH